MLKYRPMQAPIYTSTELFHRKQGRKRPLFSCPEAMGLHSLRKPEIMDVHV